MNPEGPMDLTPEKDLENWIDRELRRLPECPAPERLVNQVLGQLQRRHNMPWWRQSLWHWPAWARNLTLVLLLSMSLGLLGFGTGFWLQWDLPAMSPQDWIQSRFDFWGEMQRLAHGATWLFKMQNASSWLLGAGLFCAFVFLLTLGVGSILLQITGLRPRFTRVNIT